MKILVFDNYDSFTYNLVHMVQQIVSDPVDVYRNDAIALEEVGRYDKIIVSPGPGLPEESGLLLPLIEAYGSNKSILGVCLGQQAIAQSYGGRLINLKEVYHGVATPIHILGNPCGLFDGLPPVIEVGRYHSWVVAEEGFPDTLEITAKDEQGYIMALQHKQYDVCGVQFHPESVLTPDGARMLTNWLKR